MDQLPQPKIPMFVTNPNREPLPYFECGDVIVKTDNTFIVSSGKRYKGKILYVRKIAKIKKSPISEYGQSRLQYKKKYGKDWMHVAMADDQYKLHKLGVPTQKICNFLFKKYGHRFSSRKTWIPDGNLTTKNQQMACDKYSKLCGTGHRLAAYRLRWSVDRELDKIATDSMNCRFVRSRENTRKFEIIWSNSFCPETKRGKRILTS